MLEHLDSIAKDYDKEEKAGIVRSIIAEMDDLKTMQTEVAKSSTFVSYVKLVNEAATIANEKTLTAQNLSDLRKKASELYGRKMDAATPPL